MKTYALKTYISKNKSVILKEHTKSKNSIVIDYIKRKEKNF